MITTVTGKNQVTIPVKIATQFGIKVGTQLEWIPGDEADLLQVRVLPHHASLADSLMGAGTKYAPTEPASNVDAERISEDEERVRWL